MYHLRIGMPLWQWTDKNGKSYIERFSEDVDALHLSVLCTAGVFNCGCDCSFNCLGDLTHHLQYCNGQPKVVRKNLECSYLDNFPLTEQPYTPFKVLHQVAHSEQGFLKDMLSRAGANGPAGQVLAWPPFTRRKQLMLGFGICNEIARTKRSDYKY